MKWLTDKLFSTKGVAEKRITQQQASLKAQPQKPDPQARYLRDSLKFAQQQYKDLNQKQVGHSRWQQRYGAIEITELKKLSGIEFEEYLEFTQKLRSQEFK